jgi:luciferase family oxidoreductase group 1
VLPLSGRELSPIVAGSSAAEALRNTLDLARHAERLGYRRFWLAEHHGMPGIASAATSVVIAHVAAGTSTIRVGAGGIMLPNHSPLVIAEQFGTLESLFPGRIDLGLGRAPGSDQAVSRALRRGPAAAETFPHDVVELLSYFEGAAEGAVIRAVPGAGLDVPVWILGSSLFGAQLAAALGLPFAFASHFAPRLMTQAMELYRAQFRPSAKHASPYVMLGLNVFAAESDDEARLLYTSLQQAFVNLRFGNPGPLPAPMPGYGERLGPMERAAIAEMLACTIVGSRETVRRGIADFAASTGADELMIVAQIHDHAARVRSYELTMEGHA